MHWNVYFLVWPKVFETQRNDSQLAGFGAQWWADGKILGGKQRAHHPSNNTSYADAIVRDTLYWTLWTSSSVTSPFLKMKLRTSFKLNSFEIHFLSQLHRISTPIPIRRKSRDLRSQTVVLNLDWTAHFECPHELLGKGPCAFLSFVCVCVTELFWTLCSANIFHLLFYVSSSSKSKSLRLYLELSVPFSILISLKNSFIVICSTRTSD